MNTELSIKSSLIAPCGMNCDICRAYLREKNKCSGCRGSDENKLSSRVNCKIKNCIELKKNNLNFVINAKGSLVKELIIWTKGIELNLI